MSTRMTRQERGGRIRSVFIVGVIAGMGIMLVMQNLWPPSEDPDLRHYREVREFIETNFVHDVDRGQLMNTALKEMVGSLGPHSKYYDVDESAKVERETSGRFTGIGVIFRRPLELRQILFPVPGSPALAAGMQVGDTLLEVDGEACLDWTADQIHSALQGEVGTKLDVRVVGLDGEERELEIERKWIVDPPVRQAGLVDEEHGIGYLALITFSQQSLPALDEAIGQLKEAGLQGLILDLRGNPGGVLVGAVEIARRFIASGTIVSTEGRGRTISYDANPTEAWYEGLPLVVLVDQNSASSSEILAAALQDHRVAALVGSPTHGKGVVQTIRRYPEFGTRAKLTTSYYYTPSHRSLGRDPEQNRDYGIVPDLEISIDPREDAAMDAWRNSYGPPAEMLPLIRAWEEKVGTTLIRSRPTDPQFDAALGLLRGELLVGAERKGQ